MSPQRSDQKTILFVVAHQDDEVFIVSRIQRHLTEGDRVFVIWTAASYQKGETYKQTRLQESSSLMQKLGIPESQYHFLGYPDGSTHEHLPQLVADLKQKVHAIQPDLAYIPAYEGGHIDHDIAHFSAVQALQQQPVPPRIYEFPEYSAYGTPLGILPLRMRRYPDHPPTECRPLSKAEYQFVLDCWEIFKSQHFPLKPYIRVAGGPRKTWGHEYIRPLPTYNYLDLPPTEKVAYEKILDITHADFKQAVEQYFAQQATRV